MKRSTTNFLRAAFASALLAAAAQAQAVTEIQWWHAMTGANNDRVNALAKQFNDSQSDYKVTAVYKGSYPEAMAASDRGVPRGQRAGAAAGIRGRHRHDDGGQGRDQAGLRGDGRSGREVRSEGLRSRGGRLLHQLQGADAVVPVQQLDDGVLVQQGRVREGGPRSEPRAADLARSRRRDGQAQGLRTRVPVHDRLADVDAARELLGMAQRAVPHQGQRLRRPGRQARVQRAGPDSPYREHAGLDQEGLLRLRRPQERAGSQVLQRRVRDDDDVVGGVRHDQAERQVQVRRVHAAVLRRRRGRAAEHDHRRREPVGHGRARKRTSTRPSPSS